MKRNLLFAIAAVMLGMLAGTSVLCYHYFYPRQYVKNEEGIYENIAVARQTPTFPVNKNTVFEIEYYYPDENRTLKEETKNIPALLGCSKEGLLRYLEDYMNHLSYEDQEKGLVSYELVSYNENHIYLKKTFQQQNFTGFYAKSFNGTIVILNGDEKTVYEYTQIPINTLPENLQEEVIEGYYLEDEAALYNFLENYSI
ncbi:MAG: hypothetical protein NC300_11035 [Bacteroidales bacterium]|nr:hypothetical protein [Clostridium sp.]MCM1204664.1 hypothetical protein [Bacteroidales bacterium]